MEGDISIWGLQYCLLSSGYNLSPLKLSHFKVPNRNFKFSISKVYGQCASLCYRVKHIGFGQSNDRLEYRMI